MISVRVENLRGFEDSGEIDILPLTVLVGKNSGGKSTFLRIFPLFKQSVEKSNDGSILWISNLVDFGDFNTSFNRYLKTADRHIKFTFKLRGFLLYPVQFGSAKRVEEFSIGFHYAKTKVGEGNLRYLEILIYDHNISIKINRNSSFHEVEINGQNMTPEGVRYGKMNNPFFIPNFVELKETVDSEGAVKLSYLEGRSYSNLQNFISKYCRKNSTSAYIADVVRLLDVSSSEEILHSLKNSPGPSLKKSILKSWDVNTPEFQDLVRLYIYYRLDDLIDAISTRISDEFSSVNYIEPLRANAGRYYRIQNLAVREIDPQGANLAMYLQSMSSQRFKKYNEWVLENFDFEVQLQNIQGHTSIQIREVNDEIFYNISDMGFGFSQILPIITQIWSSINPVRDNTSHMNTRKINSIITIEQPELHLHPAMQVKFIDLLAKVLSIRKSFQFVIETHSETIINRIGQLIRRDRMDEKDVAIYVFSRKENGVDIKHSYFDESGFIKNWPIGFFEGDI